MHRLVYLWALPTTLIGLLLALLTKLSGGKVVVHTGVLEAHGGVGAWLLRHATPLPGGAAAITLGHVVLAVDPFALDFTRDHERVHVAQCERWGPLFIPAYGIASLVALARGKHFYRDNAFEVQAYDLAHQKRVKRAADERG
jgi:hypothetical protein